MQMLSYLTDPRNANPRSTAAQNPQAVHLDDGGGTSIGVRLKRRLFQIQDPAPLAIRDAMLSRPFVLPTPPGVLERATKGNGSVRMGSDILGHLQKQFILQMQCNYGIPPYGYLAAHVESENSTGYGNPEVLKRTDADNISYSLDSSDAEQQAKSATVKSWACVNFSCISSEELLKFLRYLGRMCVNNGMDFSLEPTMLVHMSSPCLDDMVLGLYSVDTFFDRHEMEEGEPKFVLVILPDDRCSDEKVEQICKDIGVVYQCCLPLFDRMAQKKYLETVANEIKAKVMEFIRLSDPCNDTSGDLMAGYNGYTNKEMGEYDGYNDEEMGEYDGYDTEEMGEDDGNSCGDMGEDDVCNEIESLQLCSSHNELCEYTSKEKISKASHSGGSPDREISDQQLQAKSATVTWACVNFSSISGKEILRFLCNLGNMCTSVGMDMSREPAMLIDMNSCRNTDFSTCLWTVSKFFNHLGVEKHKTLVVIILPDAKYCHANVESVCGNLGLVYQLCLPWHTRRAREAYMKNAANKIKSKILPCNSLPGPCEDMYEDDPEEEFYYFTGMGEDGSESDSSDVEMSDNSCHESGRHVPEELPCSDKTTGDDTHDKEDYISG